MDITASFSPQEAQAALILLEAGGKALGVSYFVPAAVLVKKLQDAAAQGAAEANQSQDDKK